MSTSYPYLKVARDHGVDYGLVLSYVDMLGVRVSSSGEESYRRPLTAWERPERFDEAQAWASAARTAMLIEHDRQVQERHRVYRKSPHFASPYIGLGAHEENQVGHPIDEECAACYGTGRYMGRFGHNDPDCPNCRGTGKVHTAVVSVGLHDDGSVSLMTERRAGKSPHLAAPYGRSVAPEDDT